MKTIFLLIFLFVPTFAISSELSLYPNLVSVGDVVLPSTGGNQLIITDQIYTEDYFQFTVTNGSQLISAEMSIWGGARGGYIQNWGNPNDSGNPTDAFFITTFTPISSTPTESTWQAHQIVYKCETTTLPVTVEPVSVEEFTAQFNQVLSVFDTFTDSQVIRKTQGDIQLLQTNLGNLTSMVATMDPLTITQSISFLLGGFSGIAFVVSSTRILS